MSLPSVMISYNQKASSNLAIKLNKTLPYLVSNVIEVITTKIIFLI